MSSLDGAKIFQEEIYQWPADKVLSGNSISCVLEQGDIFERAGANFSHIHGKTLPTAATLSRPELVGAPFSALGVSIVMHPLNPYAPTSHANFRYFEAKKPDGTKEWWFGGGFDLTPYYGFDEDCISWHQAAKNAADLLDSDAYSRFKSWADDYFYLKNRREQRGIGGIFYDDLNQPDFETCFLFMQKAAEEYLQAYKKIITLRKDHPYSERERSFQLFRRGRYVEFNLLYDRGTLFGLQSDGRTEAILMSLPPRVTWQYNRKIEPNSAEQRLTEYFLKPQDWLAQKI
jgi:coproporphyrinogen III oxidase